MTEDRSKQQTPPRMRLGYPLGDGFEAGRELPFVIGVMADLYGSPGITQPELAERKFLEIKRDNFDDVLAEIAPRLNLEVENKLERDGTYLLVELHFRSLSDFEPASIARRIPWLRKAVEAGVTGADHLISNQLDEILHAPDFQRLEASWRSLYRLALDIPETSSLKIRVLAATKKELLRDQQKAGSPDRSVVFKRIHDDECHASGGEPYGLLIGDYEFGPRPEDLQLVRAMAKVAAAAHAPFVSAASPEMFGYDDFPELSGISGFYKVFQSATYAAWRSFRDDETARYVALVLPRVLVRQPHLSLTSPAETLQYDESVRGGKDHLWGNAAYLLASVLANSFAVRSWFDNISGFDRGGLVRGLPTAKLIGQEGVVQSATDVVLVEAQAKELAELGFIPLLFRAKTGDAAFYSTPMCGKAPQYVDAQATASARLMTHLHHLLAASLIARYVKVILREKSASLRSAANREAFLNSWIQQFVVPEDLIGQPAEASYPLLDAWIEVRANPRQRGRCCAIVFLRPTSEGEEIPAPLRVAVELPE